MDKLTMRIQRNNNLNDVLVSNDPADMNNGVHHYYAVHKAGEEHIDHSLALVIFQKGARKEAASTHGVVEADLLEIVRDRLQGHQNSEYRTRENACALTHIEEALMWLAKRADDRAERGVLGTTER